jgi:hypothetical protein
MTTLVKGVAHVSFVGGGTFFPARSPDNRQALVEYVADRVRAAGRVQVLVDGQRWMVEPRGPQRASVWRLAKIARRAAPCSLQGPARLTPASDRRSLRDRN